MVGWRFWIDRGGTFTDVVARSPEGDVSIVKLLSDNPERYPDAALAGIKSVLGLGPEEGLPPDLIDEVRMGTTIATNALLERKGARTLLVVTAGFADLLAIGHQARPLLFDLEIKKPAALYGRVEEIHGRVDVQGAEIMPLDEGAARVIFERAVADGFEACAIALIHGWKYPAMELRLAELASAAGLNQVSLSHATSASAGLLPRAQTTLVDAYLSPVLRAYVDGVAKQLEGTKLYFMQSSGGLADAADLRGKDAILSGPAGGVVGALRTGEAAGFPRIIGFDMGGTSTDVCLCAGELPRAFDTELAGVALRTPMMAIHTVAAGGGSILSFDGARFRVGPDSAGAAPGPACYRRGGPLTVTDANLMVGRLHPDHFPKIFGPNGDLPLDASVVEAQFAALADKIAAATGHPRQDPRAVAEGYLAIAVANMAQAIKQVSLEKGYDSADFALQCFGGAGGQHACRVAEELGVATILIHPYAGVLSAYGMGLADQSVIRQQAIERPLDPDAMVETEAVLSRLANEAVGALARSAPAGASLTLNFTVDLRYAGADTALSVPFAEPPEMTATFNAAHARQFGFAAKERSLVIESCRVEATLAGEAVTPPPAADAAEASCAPIDHVDVWSGGSVVRAPVFDRFRLSPGDSIEGPALIREAIATTALEAGWKAVVGPEGELVLTCRRATRAGPSPDDQMRADPVRLELFNNLFMAAAERMGVVLKNTSTSVNIKERLDFSCALFDAEGRLIANAPHVPVHLGAMGESVRTVIAQRGARLKPGDMIALNDPYHGGTHLPDVTVIAPMFDPTGSTLLFFVGNRGHHADIGGLTPGSTPPESTRLEEEGVIFNDVLVCEDGAFREDAVRTILTSAIYPARNPDANISDLKAQIAANQAGLRELTALIDRYGRPTVEAYTRHVMDNAESSVRKVIDGLNDGAFDYQMDDGAHLRVKIVVDREAREATVDFTGTDAQRAGNFNAPPAVTRAAVLYAFRCLVRDDIPLNEGCLKPLKIVVPDGSFLNPANGAAVVAGNTEVSQAICNALFGALGACAASQGTMNNFLIGNDRFQYYETICGGAGAGPGFVGASAVHTHMTNTRITDPEVMEMRLPVRLESFAIRRGSGGQGRYPGGDGAVRRIRLLEAATASLVASRRSRSPFGLAGGLPGARGRDYVDHPDGSMTALAGVSRFELQPGDTVTILTPGGGRLGPAGTKSMTSSGTRPLALVTGASAGIGAAFARALASRGYDLCLVARRLDRLEALAAELRQACPIEAFALQADLSATDAHAPIMTALKARGRTIDMLVNNAGFSIPKTYAATTWAEQRDFTMTLVMAVAGLSHAALPEMIARKRGSIINVSSMAALSPGGAGHTLYPAAKSFVLKFSLSLDAEVRAKGVRVTCLIPGFVDSEFSAANGTKAVMDRHGRKFQMSPASVAEAALAGNDRGRVVVIPGWSNRLAAGLMKVLPDALTAAIIRPAAEKYRLPE